VSRAIATEERSTIAGWIVPALWGVLILVMLLLFLVAGLLLAKSSIFSTGKLSDEETKSIWAFLGVAIAAVVSLIAALLTEQHNRRSAALAEEAEQRLKIDTVSKVLELITVDGAYAPEARVAGAIATMIQLGGGTVALRVLGQLWNASAVDTETAVWLVNRVLTDPDALPDEKNDAADLLVKNVSKLVPPADSLESIGLEWPDVLSEGWPLELSSEARNSLLILASSILLEREPAFWRDASEMRPIFTLLEVVTRDDEYRDGSAYVLAHLDECGVLPFLGFELGALSEGLRSIISAYSPPPWFENLVSKFASWIETQEASPVRPPHACADADPTAAAITAESK
jgi:hypothetical protein